ncbi:MAG: hypothetical protein WEA24_14240 [Gemmatimonadota bacterium]
MAERHPALPVHRLRDAVAVRVRYRSLRQVAREVGMSPTGLRKFLDGSEPYSATRLKLEHWYVLERLPDDIPSTDAARVALSTLTRGLPADGADGARATERRLLDVLERAHARATAGHAPSWIRELRHGLQEG